MKVRILTGGWAGKNGVIENKYVKRHFGGTWNYVDVRVDGSSKVVSLLAGSVQLCSTSPACMNETN